MSKENTPDKERGPAEGSLRVPFGLRNGELVGPEDVPNGLACGCVCIGCKLPLIARQGEQRVPHFAHHRAQGSAACYETAVHRKAMELLLGERHLVLPAFQKPALRDRAGREYRFTGWLPEPLTWFYRGAQKEVAFGGPEGFRPDVALDGDSPFERLLVEVRVTHAVDQRKRKRVRDRVLSMIEIDLSKAAWPQLAPAAFRALVLEKASNRHWIHAPAGEDLYRRWEKETLAYIQERDARLPVSGVPSSQRARRRRSRPRPSALALKMASLVDTLVEQAQGINRQGRSHCWQCRRCGNLHPEPSSQDAGAMCTSCAALRPDDSTLSLLEPDFCLRSIFENDPDLEDWARTRIGVADRGRFRSR